MPLFKKKDKTIAAIDIGSASIGGMIFRQDKDGKPEVLSVKRINIRPTEKLDVYRFYKLQEETLTILLKELRKDFKRPDTILCILPPFFYVSQTRIIKVNRSDDFEITRKLFDSLINDEMKIFAKTETEIPKVRQKDNATFFESEIMKVNLNGYSAPNPFGKKTKNLELYTYISLGSKVIKERMERVIHENFAVSPIYFRTFPFTAFKVLSNMIDAQKGFLFVDIAGELTEISVVRDGILEETVSFPMGKNFLMRKIARALSVSVRESASIFERMQKEHESEQVGEKLKNVFNEVRDKWCNFFEKTVNGLISKKYLPQDLLLVGNEKIVKSFAQCLSDRDSFTDFTVLAKPFDVGKISAGSLRDHFNFSDSKIKKDIFLMIEALFANKFL